MPDSPDAYELLSVTALIAASFVNHHTIRAAELPELVSSVHLALVRAINRAPAVKPVAVPAVAVRKSVTRDYLICLEDGKKLKTLKRHLLRAYGLSPEAYRTKWGLPPDYPMVAPGYSVRRAELAKASAFGNDRKRNEASALAEDAVSVAPPASAKRRSRPLEKAA